MENDFNELKNLVLYRALLEDPVIHNITTCLKEIRDGYKKNLTGELPALLIHWAEQNQISGNLLKEYIVHLILADENIFSLYCERNEPLENSSLYELAKKDIEKLRHFSEIDLEDLFQEEYIPIIKDYQCLRGSKNVTAPHCMIDSIMGHYREEGCGIIANNPFLKYDESNNRLLPVISPDRNTFDDIISYTLQKEAIQSNTDAFLKGFPAQNILLAGARGTGKSSCVKALAHSFYSKGLRIVEIRKDQLRHLSALMALLSKRGKFFIIFIDDLSFEQEETEYKYLKSFLEGGTEKKPDNVLFYATSNRRHIIQEKWSDKSAPQEDEEIHTSDMINEKLSLADRFGMILSFSKPTPNQYLAIVEGIARKNHIDYDAEELKKEALSWELNTKGLSGRTAKQFIDHLLWEKNRG